MVRTVNTKSNRGRNGREPSQRATQNAQNGRGDSESEDEDYENGATQADIEVDGDVRNASCSNLGVLIFHL